MANMFVKTLGKPSSTIQASTLTGLGMTLLWETAMQFNFQPRATLVAASCTFVSALVGYLKKENVIGASE
jgi:hypothetical protein